MEIGLIAFFVVGTVGFAWIDYITEGKPFWKRPTFRRILRLRPKTPNLVNEFQGHVRRIRKIEEDGRKALEAIQNLHETKRRINAEYRETWDNDFRLLLPPPEAPKGREALKVKAYYRHELYAYSEPVWHAEENGIYVNTSVDLIPIGFYGKNGSYWYAFNNILGHQHKILFIPTTHFQDPSNKFHAFLPELHRKDDNWVWETNKVKTLTTNLKDLVVEVTIR